MSSNASADGYGRQHQPTFSTSRALDTRTDVYDHESVKAGEFVRRVQKLARSTGMPCRFVPSHGKGSHGTLYYADQLTTVQDLKRELPTGTLHKMLRQIGLTIADLQ